MVLGSLARRARQLQVALPPVLLVLGALAEPPAYAWAARNRVAVIVHNTNRVADLSSSQLRKILLGDETRWPDSGKITIILPPRPDSEDRKTVLKILLRMSDDDFVRHWISQVFQGEATSGPKIASSPASMVRLVAAVPSAVGFLNADALPAGDGGIKVLRVDGKLLTEDGYPLVR